MILIDVKTDDITDYKKTSLLIAFPYCSGKCHGCQNAHLQNCKTTITASADDIADLYSNLNTHEAIVMAGLEPFDSFDDVLSIIDSIGNLSKPCDFVIYTGYNLDEYKAQFEVELVNKFKSIKHFDNKNLIVKIGRYDESQTRPWYNKTLGVTLATKNQFTRAYLNIGRGFDEHFKEEKEEDNYEKC